MSATSSVSDPARHAEIPSRVRAEIRRKLLRWYDRHKRDLPWRRRGHDPYAQWVAEIMLQQTRVETVVQYYEPFLRRFPDVHALARARRDTVLKCWEGLGYYRRADHLHEAARAVHRDGNGIPVTAAQLRRLPGIGDYTAAAISSIAFGENVAAVDGNVARVVARLFAVREDVLTTVGKRRIAALAEGLLASGRPGDFNQAWMDLGSQVCTPRAPTCAACPLSAVCVAVATGRTNTLPVRGADRLEGPRKVDVVTAIFVAGRTMLVRRRPIGGLWSGLWEFPSLELSGRVTPGRGFERLAARESVTPPDRPRKVAVLRHRLTHRAFSFHVYAAATETDAPKGELTNSVRWVTLRGFRNLSVSTAHRRVFGSASELVKELMSQRLTRAGDLPTRGLRVS